MDSDYCVNCGGTDNLPHGGQDPWGCVASLGCRVKMLLDPIRTPLSASHALPWTQDIEERVCQLESKTADVVPVHRSMRPGDYRIEQCTTCRAVWQHWLGFPVPGVEPHSYRLLSVIEAGVCCDNVRGEMQVLLTVQDPKRFALSEAAAVKSEIAANAAALGFRQERDAALADLAFRTLSYREREAIGETIPYSQDEANKHVLRNLLLRTRGLPVAIPDVDEAGTWRRLLLALIDGIVPGRQKDLLLLEIRKIEDLLVCAERAL